MLPFRHDSHYLSPADFTTRDRVLIGLSLPLAIVGIFAWMETVGASPVSIPAAMILRWVAVAWIAGLWLRYR